MDIDFSKPNPYVLRPNPKGLRIPLEEYDYDWITEVNSDGFVPHPDFTKQFGTRKLSDIPPAKLKTVEEIAFNGLNRPEIVKAYQKWVSGTEEEGEIANVVVKWFIHYLELNYGVRTRAVSFAHSLIRNMAVGDWSGLDDPKCKRFLDTNIKYGAIEI